jgi:uncharacterized protein (DUF305 family)
VSNRWIVAIGAVVILIVGGAIGWAIGANTGGDHGMNHGSMAMDQKEFLAMMVAHHQGAVDMAKAEIEAGSDPKVKALAQRVITAQKREIAQMTSWYRALYGEDVPPIDEQDMEMGAMMGMSGMSPEAITDAANPDQAFLRMMIPHHAGALMMADMVLNGTPNADVKKLAETIIADQAEEIAEMQEMRTAS